MDKKPNHFTGKVQVPGAYVLVYGDNVAQSFTKFQKCMYTLCCEKYGDLGKLILSDRYPTLPPIANDVEPTLRGELIKEQAKIMMQMERNKPSMYATIWNHLSGSSELAVKKIVIREALARLDAAP